RTWVRGRGCVHARSDSMTEDEARSILEAIRKVSDLKWDAMPDLELLELRLRGLSGRARRHQPSLPLPVRLLPLMFHFLLSNNVLSFTTHLAIFDFTLLT